jgi:hypothetical protein
MQEGSHINIMQVNDSPNADFVSRTTKFTKQKESEIQAGERKCLTNLTREGTKINMKLKYQTRIVNIWAERAYKVKLTQK